MSRSYYRHMCNFVRNYQTCFLLVFPYLLLDFFLDSWYFCAFMNGIFLIITLEFTVYVYNLSKSTFKWHYIASGIVGEPYNIKIFLIPFSYLCIITVIYVTYTEMYMCICIYIIKYIVYMYIYIFKYILVILNKFMWDHWRIRTKFLFTFTYS